jgi:hypothetical protein
VLVMDSAIPLMNRRHAISLLAALPFAARLDAQTRPTAKTRVVLGLNHSLMFELGGSMQSWCTVPNPEEIAEDELGLGPNRPLPRHTLGTVRLTNVVAAAAGYKCSFAVLATAALSWGGNRGPARHDDTRAWRRGPWGTELEHACPCRHEIRCGRCGQSELARPSRSRDGSVCVGMPSLGKLGTDRCRRLISGEKRLRGDGPCRIPSASRISRMSSPSTLADHPLALWGRHRARVGPEPDSSATGRR